MNDFYILPQRAAMMLMDARSQRQIVFLSGATGYGKTSLMEHFLEGEKNCRFESAGASEALLSCLEELNRDRPKEALTLVIDDLQRLVTVPERQKAGHLLAALADCDLVWIVLISRSAIPSWLMPLHVRKRFCVINEQSLALSATEEHAYYEAHHLELLPETREEVHRLTQGYPLIQRIVVMRFRECLEIPSEYKARLQWERAQVFACQRDFYDYLDSHVYDQWPKELQEFLMDISILEVFDLEMAQYVTNCENAGYILLMAEETGSFLSEETDLNHHTHYRLRLELRLSMRRRLERRCTRLHIEELYQRAAHCYERKGDLPRALRLYEKYRDQERIAEILIQNARDGSGVMQYWEMRHYYLSLPEKLVLREPDLMVALSMLQSILMNDEKSEYYYRELCEFAKHQKGTLKKKAQAGILYLDIGLPHRGSLSMTELLLHTGTLIRERKLLLQEFSLTNNQPSILNGGKDFCEWTRRDREMAKAVGHVTEYLLGGLGKGLVSLAMAESRLEKGRSEDEIGHYLERGILQVENGGKMEMQFVAVRLKVHLLMMKFRVMEAKDLLDEFHERAVESAPYLLPNLEAMQTWLELYRGHTDAARRWLAAAPDETEEFCSLERYRYMIKARCYLAIGEYRRALRLLQKMYLYAEKRQRTYLQIECTALLAIAQYHLGQSYWQKTLGKAVQEAGDYHFVRLLSGEGTALYPMLQEAELVWQEDSFREQLMRECEQMQIWYPEYLQRTV